MLQASANAEQVCQMLKIAMVKRFIAPGNFVSNFNVLDGCEGRQKIEALEDKTNLCLAHARTFRIGERAEISIIDNAPSRSRPRESAENVEKCRLAASR